MRARWAISREVVVLPFVPVTATTGILGVIVRGASPSSAALDPLGRLAHGRLDVALRKRVEHVGHGAAHHLGPLAVRPREGHDDAVGVAGRADAHGEPRGPGLGGHGPHQPADRPGREPLPESGVRLARPGVAQTDPAGEPLGGRVWTPRPATRGPGSA